MSCEGDWGWDLVPRGNGLKKHRGKDWRNVVQSAWDLLLAPGAA